MTVTISTTSTALPVSENQSSGMNPVYPNITAPLGFLAAGIHTGIKRKRTDLSLLYSMSPATVAAVFTTNIVKAAPVLWSQAVLDRRESIHAIVVNSGNANACTGSTGMEHTRQMAESTAASLNCKPQEVMVASTGVIGVPLPIEKILPGIQQIAPMLDRSAAAGHAAAEAIMTTDTYSKETALSFMVQGHKVTLGGMAKGSGMIHPNMATMLAFITTDAAIAPELLDKALKESVDETYHMISVDGDTSTNDMVAVLANGMAGNPIIDKEDEAYDQFKQALNQINTTLAQAIVKDGEGASRFLSVHIAGAPSRQSARQLGRTVVSSNLVKAAFYGADANWGRIFAAIGYSGVPFEPERVSISIKSCEGRLSLLENGQPAPFDEKAAKAVLAPKEIEIHIDLALGEGRATAWGCDLTPDYVHINGNYRS